MHIGSGVNVQGGSFALRLPWGMVFWFLSALPATNVSGVHICVFALWCGEDVRYDAKGNMVYGPVDGVMTELTYDCRNRLLRAGDNVYTYDAENVRIAVETSSERTEIVTDSVSASLSRVLMEITYPKKNGVISTTGVKRSFVYGSGLLYEEEGTQILYHHYNNLGSTTKLTDAEGKVVASYTYGVYGELLSGDTTYTHYLYNGRCGVRTESNGLYYMRQRYYNTEIKRFINQDILMGDITNAQSLNRYSYVQGNPVSYTDPFGLSPMSSDPNGTMVAHVALSLLGFIPFVGTAASLVDAYIYAYVDHDYFNATLSLVCAAGSAAGDTLRFLTLAPKVAKGAKITQFGCEMVSNTAGFMVSTSNTTTIGLGMVDKYIVNKQSFDENTGKEFGMLALSALSMGLSAIGIKTNAKGLANTLADDVVEAAGEVTTKLVNKNTDDVISEASAKTAMGAPRQAKQAELVGGLCFVAGTKIKTITGDKNIEDIEPGDLVFAKNTVTGETGFKPVKELFLNEASELVRLEIADEIIETTYAHPFWVAGYGFKAAGELAVGDLVETDDGELYPVQSVETIYPEEKIAVYNFKVEDWHTYYVTETGILVHNSNCSASAAELSTSGGYKSGSTGGRVSNNIQDPVDLIDFRKDHILNNHKFGAGKPDKTEFPKSWNNDKIIHYVSDVATDPNASWGMGKWDSPYAIGTREGIRIRVDFYPDSHPKYSGKISTAYPLNTPPNPSKGGGI